MRPRMLIIAAVTALGLALAAPLTLVHLTHRLTWGELREVFVVPEGDGLASVRVAWEFTVGGEEKRGERSGGTTWMAWQRDGGWARPAPDPVLPIAEARAQAEQLRAEGLGQRRYRYRVLYRANDPGGSAFIQLGVGPATLAHRAGMLLVALSLLLCLPFRIGRSPARSRP